MDEFLLNETQKVSATNHWSPEFLDFDYNVNDLYQVDNISIEETKEIIYCHNQEFEYKKKKSYGIKNWNDMTRIHNNEVKIISKCNLLHDIINPPKLTKNLNIHYSTILHGCMNTKRVKRSFKTFAFHWTVDAVPWL